MENMEIELDKYKLVHKKVPVEVSRVFETADVVKNERFYGSDILSTVLRVRQVASGIRLCREQRLRSYSFINVWSYLFVTL